jgi:D-sedoheptulose 7-phosphate isomerase
VIVQRLKWRGLSAKFGRASAAMTARSSSITKKGLQVTKETNRVRSAFEEIAGNFQALTRHAETVEAVAGTLAQALRTGGKIMFCGNGGSAADAQHLAAELMGRYLVERGPLAAMALNANSSTLTAIGNDYSFDEVFARQVKGIGRGGDVLVAISTSGTSRNILRALEQARELGIATVGLAGESGGRMRPLCDQCICVPSARTPRIQEMHIAIGHMICELVEEALA